MAATPAVAGEECPVIRRATSQACECQAWDRAASAEQLLHCSLVNAIISSWVWRFTESQHSRPTCNCCGADWSFHLRVGCTLQQAYDKQLVYICTSVPVSQLALCVVLSGCSNLAGKGLTGSIPSDPGLWAGLTGLTNIDLANNQLSGSVPAAIKSAPLLSNA